MFWFQPITRMTTHLDILWWASRCIRGVYITAGTSSHFAALTTWVALQWEGTYSNNIGESNEGAVRWRPPPSLPSSFPKGPCLPAGPGCTRLKVCVHVGPLKEVRRPDGTDFLRRRISEMKSSANPAPCAPGSRGPPAYCDSSRSASSSRTLQLILGQQISYIRLSNSFIDCIRCFNPWKGS